MDGLVSFECVVDRDWLNGYHPSPDGAIRTVGASEFLEEHVEFTFDSFEFDIFGAQANTT